MNRSILRAAAVSAVSALALTLCAQDKPDKADRPAKPRPTATDFDLTELEAAAAKSLTAEAGRSRYEAFLASHTVSAKQRELIDGRMKKWLDRVDRGLVRVGAEWVTPERAREIGKVADDLIFKGYKQFEAGDYKASKESLEKAAKADPSGVRADFILGMLNSPNRWNYAPAALKHFETCWRRDPENVALLNNLALSYVKMGRYPEAIDRWSEALRGANEVPDVVGNLGRFVQETTAKRLVVPQGVTERATRVYDKAVAEKKGPLYDPKNGWMYSAVVLSIDERKRTELSNEDTAPADQPATGADAVDAKAITVSLGGGTGFVVHPHYVLTNRHVVDDASFLRIVDPNDRGKELDAKIVGFAAAGLDLALVRCEGLNAAPLPFFAGKIRRGTDVMVLGFPMFDVVGESLKSTRGQVTSLPADDYPYLLIDATVNPGNSGGPILDRSGNVIAVCTIKAMLTRIGGDNYGGAQPIDWALPLLRKQIDGFAAPQSEHPLEWPDVDEKCSPSTVLIKSYGLTVPLAVRRRTPGAGRKPFNVFEDRTCVACKGRRQVACPVIGCYRGSVTEFENAWELQYTSPKPQVLTYQLARSKSCPGCRGAGVVDCRHCANGIDPRL